MSARYLVGDVYDRLNDIPNGTVDLVLTSPPFLALRSYLPDDHPNKAKEIGSEATPAHFLDTLLALTAIWGDKLAPHGSLAIELGDTYAGSGGAGGDYHPDGIRRGQERFDGSARRNRPAGGIPGVVSPGGTTGNGNGQVRAGTGWPLDKSLCGIPTLYAWSLAYGTNLLTGQPSPAGRWRIRNIKPWIRSNPPVGALGDKERPATSYVTVATRHRDRYFDLDAVRTASAHIHDPRHLRPDHKLNGKEGDHDGLRTSPPNPGGAPPLDWWHHVDAVLDAALTDYAGGTTNPRAPKGTRRRSTGKTAAAGRGGNWAALDTLAEADGDTHTVRGLHLRRALERAGILTTLDALDVSPKGYAGAHYAVWPPELVRLLVSEMCPYKVCTTCGQPSRRIAETTNALGKAVGHSAHRPDMERRTDWVPTREAPRRAERVTVGWTDCGHGTWRPGLVLDPFAGSGTTLAVCTGMARDAIGIDLDERNSDLARERVGMFLEVDHVR